MFTGLVEDRGTLVSAAPSAAGRRVIVRTKLDLSDTKLGDSIAVDGVCLTVVEQTRDTVAFDVGPETMAVTTLATKAAGAGVHLERAVRLSDRLGGHLVQGHVDGMGRVASRATKGDALFLRIEAPPAVLALCIPKGSIAVEGVSLTINALDDTAFEVCLIPHTLAQTHLGALAQGDPVNLENDLVGKYVQRLLAPHAGSAAAGGVTWDGLVRAGFVDG
jgi:riboflavin synthase